MKKNKLFKIEEIFEIKKGKRLTKANMIEGTLNYIGAISTNNGVRQKINEIQQYEKNCITVNYNGSVGEAFYQDQPFWASDDVNILLLKEYNLNRNIAMYLITIIKANKYQFSYGRKWTKEKMSKTKLLLPVTENNKPDWHYIESYISNLKHKVIRTKLKAEKNTISVVQWQKFKISELFEIYLAKAYHNNNLESKIDGLTYITRTGGNNGEEKRVQNEDFKIEAKNAITVGAEGVVFFYRNTEFICGNKVSILRHPKLNKYNGLFLITILNHGLKEKFSYGRALILSKVKELEIILPITKESEPDWIYMEEYIKTLPYSDKI